MLATPCDVRSLTTAPARFASASTTPRSSFVRNLPTSATAAVPRLSTSRDLAIAQRRLATLLRLELACCCGCPLKKGSP